MSPNPEFSACPDPQELVAFSRGLLPERRLETIAGHIASCPACETSIGHLLAEDTLGSLLPAGARLEFVDEPACDRLESKAKAISVDPCEATTVAERLQTELGIARLPREFAAYEIITQIDKGGMGVVYRVRHRDLNRQAALKVMREGFAAAEWARTRFKREGESLARLDHANIVKVYDSGVCNDRLYLVMELLEGGNLAERLKRGALEVREAAQLICTLARAVHAVHQCNVVHRDLKPSNIVFAGDGTPKITDFGLAKVLDATGRETVSQAILGTPQYMAPEQAEGGSREVTAAADIYALGVILYECLTQRPPIMGETKQETMNLVRYQEPESPSRYRATVPRALEEVCLKCLEKKPSWRHASAAELADRLQEFLDGKSRPRNRLQRVAYSIRRHSRIAACVALVGLLALGISAAQYVLSPDRAAEAIEAKLRAGIPATLIGDTGGPGFSRWVKGAEVSQMTVLPNAPFSMHSDNLAMLDLVRTPILTHFRLRAEVQHNRVLDPEGNSSTGIYVARTAYASEGGTSQQAVLLTFNDIISEQAVFERGLPIVPPKVKVNKPTANSVYLQSRLIFDADPFKDITDLLVFRSAPLFQPTGNLGDVWRELRLDVTPEGISAYWDNVLVGNLTAAQLGPESRQRVRDNRERPTTPENPFRNGFELQYTPQGSIGICVFCGTASFRRVVLEPLSP